MTLLLNIAFTPEVIFSGDKRLMNGNDFEDTVNKPHFHSPPLLVVRFAASSDVPDTRLPDLNDASSTDAGRAAARCDGIPRAARHVRHGGAVVGVHPRDAGVTVLIWHRGPTIPSPHVRARDGFQPRRVPTFGGWFPSTSLSLITLTSGSCRPSSRRPHDQRSSSNGR